jgi:DNA-binding transcriptional ArsR family regulator
MVKYSDAQLNQTFAALVDPTRRAILARLEREPGLSISDLARPLSVKLPGVMKHLDVLSDAGLIRRTKNGRTVLVELTPGPMEEATAWLKRYERFWSERLDRLALYAERKDQQVQDKPAGKKER